MSSDYIKTKAADSFQLGSTGAEPQVGKLILERYRIFDWKAGGFAYVAAAQDERSGQWYAIKFPKDESPDWADFEGEMRFWLELDPHPNIVRAYKVVPVDGKPALFLEYVGGAHNTLRSRLIGHQPLAQDQALQFLWQITVGMEAASGANEVAHLDLKPENLMIAPDGTLKVADFGSARRVQVVNGRYPRVTNGSWPYMAPEWFEGNPVDSRGDIYSWGVIALETLTGRLPFELSYTGDLFPQMQSYHKSGKLRELTSELYWHGVAGLEDRQLRETVSCALQEYPGERPRSFRELRAAFDKILNLEIGSATPQREFTVEEKFEQALSLCEIGQVDRAKTLFNNLMVQEPNNVQLWRKIATVMELLNDGKTAKQIKERL